MPEPDLASINLAPAVRVVPKHFATPTPTPSPSPTAKIAIYADATCTTALSSISWGQVTPGATVDQTLYIRNEGQSAVSLYKSVTNWTPTTLSNYLTLSWNYADQTINPNDVLEVTLFLSVAANTPATSSFGFDTVITATSN